MSKWSTYRRRGGSKDFSIMSGYVSRIAAAGGTISDASLQAVSDLVDNLQMANLWNRMLDVWPCAGNQLAAALVKVKVAPGTVGAYTAVNFVGGDYTESGGSGGLISNGTTKYLSGGPSMLAMGLLSSMTVSVLGAVIGGSTRAYCGVVVGGDQLFLGSLDMTTSTIGRLLLTAAATDANAAHAATWTINRESSTNLRLYDSGAPTGSSATAVSANSSPQGIYLYAYNSAGAPAGYVQARYGFACFGGAMTAAEVAQLASIVATFNAALGR